METCPAEIWQEIFALACTDTGYTGRSLSLVSKYIHDISGPFKYQSLAITQWRQIIIFSQIFLQLPDSQKKIKYLFVDCPYPFVDVEDDPMLEDSSSIGSEGSLFDPDMTDEVSDESDDISEPESVSDSDFEGSLNSEDERELLEDARYLQAVSNDRSQSPDGSTRDNVLRDAEIQSFFDHILYAFRDILNETSSTLTILGVYWTSLRSPQIHRLLPPLPCLQELHLYRRGLSHTYDMGFGEPTTTLLPLLRLLYISGDHPQSILLTFKDDLARLAPNLTHIRCPFHCLRVGPPNPQNSAHSLNLDVGGIIVEHRPVRRESWRVDQLLRKANELTRTQFKTSVKIAIEQLAQTPEAWHWQRWWTSRVAGEVGPWKAIGCNESPIN